AVVGGGGHAGVVGGGRVAAGQHLVGRTTDLRRRGVGKADVLHAFAVVAAGVGRFPLPVNAPLAGAVGRCRRVGEGDRGRAAAVVGGGGHAGVVGGGRVAAGQHLVGRTTDLRRRGVGKADVLHAFAVVA